MQQVGNPATFEDEDLLNMIFSLTGSVSDIQMVDANPGLNVTGGKKIRVGDLEVS